MGIINEEVFYGLLLALAGFLLSMIGKSKKERPSMAKIYQL